MVVTISAIVLTQNNQNTLTRCLQSLSWVDQLLVIDDYSADKTASIAKKHHAQVIKRQLDGNWAAQRNFALEHATSDWILFIDSDEYLSPDLINQIKAAIKKSTYVGYYLCRQDIFLGQPLVHTEAGHIKLLRLAQKHAGQWTRPVHERWDIKGKVGILPAPLFHQRQFSLTQFIDRLSLYGQLDAKALVKEGKPFTKRELVKPIAKFFYNYIYLLGFLDGLRGLFFSYLMFIYSFTVRVISWHAKNTA